MRNDGLLTDKAAAAVIDLAKSGGNPEDDGSAFVKPKPQPVFSGWRKTLVKFRMRSIIMRIVLQQYRNPNIAAGILRKLILLRRSLLGPRSINKFAKVDGKYYCDLYTPGIGSVPFERFIESEASRFRPYRHKVNRFVNVFVSVTKSCPLSCEHCFEWDTMNRPETLSEDDIISIIGKVQQLGTSQIQITGGEPLTHIERVMSVLQAVKSETEVWLLTSGYNLTFENAGRLKRAGLTGVVVSLDSADPAAHNRFRGSERAFQWATQAAANAVANNLVTALSLCATNDFISSPGNLMRYAQLAKDLGVSFIQVLEPRAAGHYAGKDVELTTENELLLEEFYQTMNYNRQFSDYPIISYIGQFSRRVGCLSSGDRNLYIDTDGDLHACPFCRSKLGKFLSPDAEALIGEYKAEGCHRYGKFTG